MILLTLLPVILTLAALRIMERAMERSVTPFDPDELRDNRPHYNRREDRHD